MMKSYEKIAQRVWATSRLEDKREILLAAIDNYAHPRCVSEHKQFVMLPQTTSDQLDFFAANIALRGSGNQVISDFL